MKDDNVIWMWLVGTTFFLGLLLIVVVSICLSQRSNYRRQLKAATISAFGTCTIYTRVYIQINFTNFVHVAFCVYKKKVFNRTFFFSLLLSTRNLNCFLILDTYCLLVISFVLQYTHDYFLFFQRHKDEKSFLLIETAI